MKSTERKQNRKAAAGRLMAGALCACLLSLGAQRVAATDEYYVNNSIVAYPGTFDLPPVIDALNFVNNSTFSINFTISAFQGDQPFYETWNTQNVTNNGTLIVNSGFEFSTQSSISGFRTRAANFNNSGLISCASAENPDDPFGGLLSTEGYAQCLVDATNIECPGEVDTGSGGLIKFTGKNVNVYQGLLNIETSASAGGVGEFGLFDDTWNPFFDLSPGFVLTPPFNLPPGQIFSTNAVAFTATGTVGTNTLFGAVYIQNDSPGVLVHVFFGTPPPAIGFGQMTIEWAGSHLDSATGLTTSNYLYLNDDPVLGMSTNRLFDTPGVTRNFKLISSTVPLMTNFVASPVDPIADIYPHDTASFSNYYDVARYDLGVSVSTNSIANHSVTNLPSRVEITGDDNLDLRRVQISGPNYMALRSTNQFHGADGALIQTPYADLDLGVTNGFLTISNVMQGQLPVWGGTIVAWNSAFWIPQSAGNTASNFYWALVVNSKINPTLNSQVQDLVLHGSNSITISDTFNVMRKFNADARSLTLVTNPVGNGATALDGELNLESAGIFWQSCVPNLRYLTNNGAIRTANLFYFGYPTLTNYSSSVASGILSEIGTNVVRKDKVTIGTNVYMFVGKLTNTVANQVMIVPSSFDSTLNNLIAAINGGGASGPGVSYSTATKAHPLVTAGPLNAGAFRVSAISIGTAGNSIASTFTRATTATNLSWGGHATLYGGAPLVATPVSFLDNTAFIQNGILQDQGSILYAGNFVGSGIISNGIGAFTLQSLTTTLTNVVIDAGADVSITADSLTVSNSALHAARSLTLQVTNLLTDMGYTNNNVWLVGSNSVGSGFNLLVKPVVGDLLGTTVTLTAPENRTVANTWAGADRGLSPAGYTNNAAIGKLTLDVASSLTPSHNGVLSFTGTGVSNAIYIDLLVLTNFATHGNATNNYNFPWLKINTNMMVYFGQALENGASVAEAIDTQSQLGANSGRLRWVSSYAGYYSSTNSYFTNSDATIVTNVVNTALAQSTHIDSDSDGRVNLNDVTPFFMPQQINFSASMTNLPPQSVRIQWTTLPNATNYIFFATNVMATNWLPLTNFNNWYYGNNVAVTNGAHLNSLRSPQTYINSSLLPDNAQRTNVWLFDTVTNVPHYYKVMVWPYVNFTP